VEKHWFVVRDTSIKTERLLSLMQVRGQGGPIACTQANRESLQELFVTLQHPYIYPVLDVDFAELCGRMHVITVLPLNQKGSLKDFIYKVHSLVVILHFARRRESKAFLKKSLSVHFFVGCFYRKFPIFLKNPTDLSFIEKRSSHPRR